MEMERYTRIFYRQYVSQFISQFIIGLILLFTGWFLNSIVFSGYEHRPADSNSFRIRMSKVTDISEICAIINEMLSETENPSSKQKE
jgi:hypothetical protein